MRQVEEHVGSSEKGGTTLHTVIYQGHVPYSRVCLVWRTVLSPYRSICSANSRQPASRPGQTSALENGD